MTRRRLPTGPFDDEPEATPAAALLDSHAGHWTPADRTRLAELFEDAATELQRDLLERALVMGHTVQELHAFADSIRPLADAALFTACTPPRGGGHDMATLLRAQADPLAAFELHRRQAAPRRARTPAAAPVKLPPWLLVDRAVAPSRPRREQELGVSAETAPPADGKTLGGGAELPRAATTRTGFAADLFDAAAEFAQLRFAEHVLDLGRLSLEQALVGAAAALARGVPVPVVLGSRPGDLRRWALLLQVQASGRSRAFQLYDPFAQEVAWAHEGDLLGRAELPFADKSHRRLTAIALPRLPSAGVAGIASGFEELG